ncbi:Os06g0219550 [Oryza sativa Japonica Group]|uniref:Os06g0219550 protein n=1 Tax=Oryza sativa subsp. japonica TaxID=39947 RepID=A0A0P0WU37_ORYSJ|nr:Os06g0219550 [Oryza sativa Japonica Group]
MEEWRCQGVQPFVSRGFLGGGDGEGSGVAEKPVSDCGFWGEVSCFMIRAIRVRSGWTFGCISDLTQSRPPHSPLSSLSEELDCGARGLEEQQTKVISPCYYRRHAVVGSTVPPRHHELKVEGTADPTQGRESDTFLYATREGLLVAGEG